MAKPVSATLFAYQVGFGDCFLLRFIYADQKRRHMLIDFGTTGLPEDAERSRMLDIANDIRDKVREHSARARLDVLVATHRHADHISGFATRDGAGSGDVIRSLKPRVVIQPWTEAPDAPLDSLGPDPAADRQAFARHRRSLKAMQEVAGQAAAFAAQHGRGLPRAIAEQLSFIGKDNLSNLSAVENLQTMGDRREYVFHGCDPKLGRELPGIQVHVLGPPTLRQTDTIRQQRSRDTDEFWQLAPRRFSDAVGRTADGPEGGGKLFPHAAAYPRSKLPTEHRWLAGRLNTVNAELMLSLVRALDRQMNNTSVILLLRAGDKTLLFPGDAQLENWQYALQSSLADHLADVDLYKVGHHGSLNATPRSMWNRFSKRGGPSARNRLTSVLSTMHGKHGKDETNTEVPRRTLVAELDAQSTLWSTDDPPSFQWTPMLAFRSWRGVSDEYDAPDFPGYVQARGGGPCGHQRPVGGRGVPRAGSARDGSATLDGAIFHGAGDGDAAAPQHAGGGPVAV